MRSRPVSGADGPAVSLVAWCHVKKLWLLFVKAYFIFSSSDLPPNATKTDRTWEICRSASMPGKFCPHMPHRCSSSLWVERSFLSLRPFLPHLPWMYSKFSTSFFVQPRSHSFSFVKVLDLMHAPGTCWAFNKQCVDVDSLQVMLHMAVYDIENLTDWWQTTLTDLTLNAFKRPVHQSVCSRWRAFGHEWWWVNSSTI